MNSRIFDGRYRPSVQHGDIEAEAVDQDDGDTPASTVELLESGVDVVENAPNESPIADALAQTKWTVWEEACRRSDLPPRQPQIVSGATQIVHVPGERVPAS